MVPCPNQNTAKLDTIFVGYRGTEQSAPMWIRIVAFLELERAMGSTVVKRSLILEYFGAKGKGKLLKQLPQV